MTVFNRQIMVRESQWRFFPNPESKIFEKMLAKCSNGVDIFWNRCALFNEAFFFLKLLCRIYFIIGTKNASLDVKKLVNSFRKIPWQLDVYKVLYKEMLRSKYTTFFPAWYRLFLTLNINQYFFKEKWRYQICYGTPSQLCW